MGQPIQQNKYKQAYLLICQYIIITDQTNKLTLNRK